MHSPKYVVLNSSAVGRSGREKAKGKDLQESLSTRAGKRGPRLV